MAAQSLINAGEMDYVKKNLWTGSDSNLHGGAIKYDLDYIINNYATSTCDLWEEVRDADFFWNRATMKKAMIAGASFANQMGDSATAQKYLDTMRTINGTLYKNHYNGKFVLESNGRTQDSAVIVGFNDAFDESDMMFAPTSIEVANTVNSYNLMFCSEYAINTADTANNIPGVLYGRYQHGKSDNFQRHFGWFLSLCRSFFPAFP
jgi:glucoamylase